MRLLVCDDNRPLVDALSTALTSSGHTVVATALDPDEAVLAAREHQPDACLLDMSFPHASGLSAIARIHEVSADTKIVMLSWSLSRTLVADAIAQGAQGFVSKEKPVAVIVEALTLADRGALTVDPSFRHDDLPTWALGDDVTRAAKPLTDRERGLLRSLADSLSTVQATAQRGTPHAAAGIRLLRLFSGLFRSPRMQPVGPVKADS